MLFIYYGGDRVKALNATEKALAKTKAGEVILFDEANVSIETLLPLAEQQRLFFATEGPASGGGMTIKLDNVFSNEEAKEMILKNLESFSKSPNIFIFLEDSLLADEVKQFKKFATTIEEFKLVKKREDFNIFALADAFGLRDKKSFWVMYRRAIEAGKSGEEIAGTLFWQMKAMLIVEKGGGATLSPFISGKSKRYIKNFKEGELEKMAGTLIQKYHDAHRGKGDLETALERFALAI